MSCGMGYRTSSRSSVIVVLCAAVLPWLAAPRAADGQTAATSAPIIGTVETLKLYDSGDVWSGGVMVVAGQVVVIPRNLIIELPANFLTLQQIFAQAPAACAALGESGLAADDACVDGRAGAVATILANRTAAGDVIAGDVFLEKGQDIVSGRVTFIDHTDGYFRVNGRLEDDATGVMVRINDPDGRHTIQQGKGCAAGPNCSADPRFTNDPDNYTITFSTGYPACIPSTVTEGARTVGSDDAGLGDPLCPAANRGADPVPDATRFAPIQLGDFVVVSGNYESINGVAFLSAFDVTVNAALKTADDPTQPDYMLFDEVEWDVAGFQNERVRLLLIGFTTHPDSQLDVFSLHVDPTTNANHEVPLASTVGNPLTVRQGIGLTNAGIFKIRYDIDFFEGLFGGVRPELSACMNLRRAGFPPCPAVSHLGPEFSIVSPITRELIGRTRHKQAHPDLQVLDIRGNDAPWGEYLTPVGVGHPEFVEIDLDALQTPFIFAGEPWNLDRRLSPGGCVDISGDGIVDCEATPQPLDPFPFSELDPRTQALVPFAARDRILSALGPNGPATTVLNWPPVNPPFQGAVPVPVEITRATVKEDVDCTKIDVWATSDLAGDLVVSVVGVPPQTMVGDGAGRFFAHVSLPAGVPIPSSITVTQTANNSTATRPVTDEVAVVHATYDIITHKVVIKGTSSTSGGATSLALDTGVAVDAHGEVTIVGVQVPPRTVTMVSGDGGAETRPVIVNPTASDTLAVTLAAYDQDVGQWTITGTSSVPGPGNAVVAYLGEPVIGTLIGAAVVDPSGGWIIITSLGSPADPNIPGAPGTISVQSTPLGGVVDDITYTTDGPPPVIAQAGPDQNAHPGDVVVLDGTGSTGPIAGYAWTQIDGPTVALSDTDAASVTLTFPNAAPDVALTFQLTVTGPQGTHTDTIVISGFGAASPLVAVPVIETTLVLPDDGAVPSALPSVLVQLGSGDSEGVIDGYAWVQTSGPPVTLGILQLDGTIVADAGVPDPVFIITTPPGETTLSFELTVSGPAGTDTASVTVPLVFVPPPVIADAGPDVAVFAGELVTLNGAGSTGAGLQFAWAQVAGPPVGGPPFGLDDPTAAVATFFFPGLETPLTFQLTVTDVLGTVATDTVTISRVTLPPAPSLKTVTVPEPDNLMDFIKDKPAAIKLGKALFWDMQVGGDGMQACATCHYHAGADTRFRNTLNPGHDGVFDVGGPNHVLQLDDFPILDDDIVGSQGVVKTDFIGVVPGVARDDGVTIPDVVHHVGGINTRQVTGRNAPSVINAVFNVRSFWDGRANFVFNGVNPFGLRDPADPRILMVQPDGSTVPVSIQLEKSSLASQAVGPPNNEVEMSWNGRTFAELGRKLLNLRPLARQAVDTSDGVLGGLVDPSGRGLATTYAAMVEAAFAEAYWDTTQPTPDGFSVMEANFSLFFGLAIQVYEATLVSDNAPYDRWREGDAFALTEQQRHGFDIFMNQGLCFECHVGAEFTGATVGNLIVEDPTEHMVMADRETAVYDNAFYNIGVRPTGDDPGVGGTDPFGNPLSFTKLSQQGEVIGPPMLFEPEIDPALRTAVNGSFKVPSLRNVALTGPYMHHGGFATLEEVVDFYAGGGFFIQENIADADTSIRPLPLSVQDRADLVAFLNALTDERVRLQQAPFDHPELFIANGHTGDATAVTDSGSGGAVDRLVRIPAVGAAGGPPLHPFAEPGVGTGFGQDPPPLGACCTGGVCDVTAEADCAGPTWLVGTVCSDDIVCAADTPGDLDGDADVDFDDFFVFLAAMGSTEGSPAWNPAADYDGDGVVGFPDYATWIGLYMAANP